MSATATLPVHMFSNNSEASFWGDRSPAKVSVLFTEAIYLA